MSHHLFTHTDHYDRHALKDVQFAVGMIVALGGAGVIVVDLLRQFS